MQENVLVFRRYRYWSIRVISLQHTFKLLNKKVSKYMKSGRGWGKRKREQMLQNVKLLTTDEYSWRAYTYLSWYSFSFPKNWVMKKLFTTLCYCKWAAWLSYKYWSWLNTVKKLEDIRWHEHKCISLTPLKERGI